MALLRSNHERLRVRDAIVRGTSLFLAGAVFYRRGGSVRKKKPILYVHHARPLTGEYAFMTAEFLESIVHMLWREFGDDMADFQGRVFPDDPTSQYEYLYCKRPRSRDGDQF